MAYRLTKTTAPDSYSQHKKEDLEEALKILGDAPLETQQSSGFGYRTSCTQTAGQRFMESSCALGQPLLEHRLFEDSTSPDCQKLKTQEPQPAGQEPFTDLEATSTTAKETEITVSIPPQDKPMVTASNVPWVPPQYWYSVPKIQLPEKTVFMETTLQTSLYHQQLIPQLYDDIRASTLITADIPGPILGMIIIWRIREAEKTSVFQFDSLPAIDKYTILKILTGIKRKLTGAYKIFELCNYIQESNNTQQPPDTRCLPVRNPHKNHRIIKMFKNIKRQPELIGQNYSLSDVIEGLDYFCCKFLAKKQVPMGEKEACLFQHIYGFCHRQMEGLWALSDMHIDSRSELIKRRTANVLPAFKKYNKTPPKSAV